MRILPSLAGVALVALLSGCLPQESTVTPTPQPSSTPVFASEEEALAAAEAAYAEYLAVSDAIAQDGGKNPERLADLVTPEWLEKEVEVFGAFADSGRRQQGSTVFAKSELQQLSEFPSGAAELTMYVCTDFSSTTFVDADGNDVTPTDRSTVVSLEIIFEIRPELSDHILLGGSEPWSGESFC